MAPPAFGDTRLPTGDWVGCERSKLREHTSWPVRWVSGVDYLELHPVFGPWKKKNVRRSSS